jgi:hypothetical protein
MRTADARKGRAAPPQDDADTDVPTRALPTGSLPAGTRESPIAPRSVPPPKK